MTKKRRKPVEKKDKERSSIDHGACLTICEDKDGRVIFRSNGKCPKGYIEKIAAKLRDQEEVRFVVPKAVTVEEEE